MRSTALLLAALLASPVFAAPVDDAVAALQQEWEQIRYQAPAKQREARFEQLAGKARQASEQFAGRPEPLIWEGIVLSSWAGEKGERMRAEIPVGRFARPSEIAAAALYLASSEAGIVNGENLVADGGFSIH